MVNKYKNLQQLVLVQRQYKLLQSSMKFTKDLLYDRKIVVYKPQMKDIIIYNSNKQ